MIILLPKSLAILKSGSRYESQEFRLNVSSAWYRCNFRVAGRRGIKLQVITEIRNARYAPEAFKAYNEPV